MELNQTFGGCLTGNIQDLRESVGCGVFIEPVHDSGLGFRGCVSKFSRDGRAVTGGV